MRYFRLTLFLVLCVLYLCGMVWNVIRVMRSVTNYAKIKEKSAFASGPPNIIIIVADDLGYNDVSWHDPNVITPNLDELARDGIILEGHYVQETCTPTRSALMTSYYPIHTGRQNGPISTKEPIGLYTNYTLMPEYFKDIGYRTHAIGKWHLGYCNEDYLPTRGGFDTFYGFYNSQLDHFKHSTKRIKPPLYDFRDQDETDYTAKGTYSALLFGQRAVKIVDDHVENHLDTSMFMYFAFQTVHWPIQVPIEYEKMYPNVTLKIRKRHLGMISAMDDMVGMLIEKLKDTGIYNNTIIVFTSDNGGGLRNGGTNWPLRGTKRTWWEGGTRSVAFVYSYLLKEKETANGNLFHVVDWLPTLLSAVKDELSVENQQKVEKVLSENRDGINQWPMLVGAENITREEMVYNILKSDGKYKGAIRIGDYKLCVGYPPGKKGEDGYYFPQSIRKYLRKKLIPYLMDEEEIYLFNLKDDPNEYINIAKENLEVVKKMRSSFEEYVATIIPEHTANNTDASTKFGGVLSPGWCESAP